MGDRWVALRVLTMLSSSRRSFVIRAGWTAAASLCRSGRAGALEGPGQTIRLREARSLIEPERKTLLRAMEAADIPGAAVCLIHAGKPSWVEGFGVTDRQSGRRVAADTIFSIQSTSKHITATAVMLAVQSGLLDLARPITAYLPDFTLRGRAGREDHLAAVDESPRGFHPRSARGKQLRPGLSELRGSCSQRE